MFVVVGVSVDCCGLKVVRFRWLVDGRRLEGFRFRWLVSRLWFIESRSFPLVDFHPLKVVHLRCLVGRLSPIVSLSIVLAGG